MNCNAGTARRDPDRVPFRPVSGAPFENYIPVRAPAVELVLPSGCAGLRLDQALAGLLPDFSRSRLQTLIKAGAITLDGTATNPKHKVWGGEKVRVDAQPATDASEPAEKMALEIVHEDRALLVINKPAGLVVHPGSGNLRGTLLNALLYHAPQLAQLPRAGIVHRLDKDTSGLLVVAKTPAAHINLVRQLQARSVVREYLALVHGSLAGSGVVTAPIGRHPMERTRMAVSARGKPAVTHYRVLERLPHFNLVRCRLETGRTHQIRVHMQSLGHPLVGDPVYGKKKTAGLTDEVRAGLAGFRRQALHAARLKLDHPESGRTVQWVAEMPRDMSELLGLLRVIDAA